MSNCTKCQIEITQAESNLFSGYCQSCFHKLSREDLKKLSNFCSHCGCGTWHAYHNGIRCGECGR